MQKQNKREKIAALHRQMILESAKELFLQHGYEATSMDEICKESTYSRRTIYSYFESKEDIYLHLVAQGLVSLHDGLVEALNSTSYFMARYRAICAAMKAYTLNHPHSFNAVNRFKPDAQSQSTPSGIMDEIFSSGESINQLLVNFIKEGIEQGIVLETVQPRQTVYILWASISSLLDMVVNKEQHITRQFGIPANEFLQYGFDQIIDSILEERIHGTA
jgi:AcrR family transcriptional regulator